MLASLQINFSILITSVYFLFGEIMQQGKCEYNKSEYFKDPSSLNIIKYRARFVTISRLFLYLIYTLCLLFPKKSNSQMTKVCTVFLYGIYVFMLKGHLIKFWSLTMNNKGRKVSKWRQRPDRL